jgi:hypothetical protein
MCQQSDTEQKDVPKSTKGELTEQQHLGCNSDKIGKSKECHLIINPLHA